MPAKRVNPAKHHIILEKSPNWLLAAIIAAAALLFIGWLATHYRWFSGDGTANLAGAQLEVARKSLTSQYMTYPGTQNINLFVDRVYPTSSEDVMKFCTPYGDEASADSQKPQHYSVVIIERQIFKADKKITFDGCYIMSRDTIGSSPLRYN